MRKLKEKLNAKLSKNGGFTLIEMLIVVAIIAILIAVSIPLVSSALDKAREATDDANERSALSLGTIYYLTNPDVDFSTDVEMYYHIDSSHEGSLKAKDEGAPSGYGLYGTNKGHYIIVTINDTDDENIVTTKWST